jgi:uncharacterized protein YndB with AHSA1/START domain
MTSVADTSVKKSVTVNTSVERAFEVFTSGFDGWWPRSHHIGKSPMTAAIIEAGVGGRCYTRQEDGTDCTWGQVLAWDPPHRFVMAWQITHEWGYESDLAKSSEVEVRFTAEPGGGTRVDLEHRHFERMGAGGAAMRVGVSGPGGWPTIMELFKARAEQAAPEAR